MIDVLVRLTNNCSKWLDFFPICVLFSEKMSCISCSVFLCYRLRGKVRTVLIILFNSTLQASRQQYRKRTRKSAHTCQQVKTIISRYINIRPYRAFSDRRHHLIMHVVGLNVYFSVPNSAVRNNNNTQTISNAP